LDLSVLNTKDSKKALNIWSRRSVIPFTFIGKNVFVHNGLGFKKVHVDLNRVGFKFGTFVPTRKFVKKLKNKK
jgi:ribosomal protein S19